MANGDKQNTTFLDTAQRDQEALRFAIGRLHDKTEDVIKWWNTAEKEQQEKLLAIIKKAYPIYDTTDGLFWALGDILRMASDTTQPPWSSVQSPELTNLLTFIQAIQVEIQEIDPRKAIRTTQNLRRVEAPIHAPQAIPPREPPSPDESAEFLSQPHLDIDVDSRTGDCVLRDPLQAGNEIARIAGFQDAELEEHENTSRAITFEVKHNLGEIYIHVDWEERAQTVHFLVNGQPSNLPIDRGIEGIEQVLRYFAEYLEAERADTGKFQNPLEPQRETAREQKEIPSHLPQLWSALAFSRDDLRSWGKAEEPAQAIREKLRAQFTSTHENQPNTTEFLKAGQDKAVYRPDLGVYMICDGVSSQQSEPIVEYTTKVILEKLEAFHINLEDPDIIGPALDEVIKDTTKEVYDWARSQGLRGATTLTLCVFRGSRLFTLNIGDSPASIYRPHNPVETRFETLTVDHNITFELYQANQAALDLIHHHFRNASDPRDAQYLGDIQISPPLLEVCEHYSQVLARENVQSKRRLAITELKVIAQQARGTALLNAQDSRRVIELLYDLESMIANGIGQVPKTAYSLSVHNFGPDDILCLGSDNLKTLREQEKLTILEHYDPSLQATIELGTSIVENLVQKRPRAGIDDSSIMVVKHRQAATAIAEYIGEARTMLTSINRAEVSSKAEVILSALEENNEGKSPYEICRMAKQVRDKVEKIFKTQEESRKKIIEREKQNALERKASALLRKNEEINILCAQLRKLRGLDQNPSDIQANLDFISKIIDIHVTTEGTISPDLAQNIVALLATKLQTMSEETITNFESILDRFLVFLREIIRDEEREQAKIKTLSQVKKPSFWKKPWTYVAAGVLATFIWVANKFLPTESAPDNKNTPEASGNSSQQAVRASAGDPIRDAGTSTVDAEGIQDAASAVPDLPLVAENPLADATFSPDWTPQQESIQATLEKPTQGEPTQVESNVSTEKVAEEETKIILHSAPIGHRETTIGIVVDSILEQNPKLNLDKIAVRQTVARFALTDAAHSHIREGNTLQFEYSLNPDKTITIHSITEIEKDTATEAKPEQTHELKTTAAPQQEDTGPTQVTAEPEREQSPGKTIQIGSHSYKIGKPIEYIPLAAQPGQYTILGLSKDGKAVLLKNANNPKATQFAVNLKNIESRILSSNTEKFTINGFRFEKLPENTYNIHFTTLSGKGVIDAIATLLLHTDYADNPEKLGAAIVRANDAVRTADTIGHIADSYDATIGYSDIPNLVVSTDNVIVSLMDNGKVLIKSSHFARSKTKQTIIY